MQFGRAGDKPLTAQSVDSDDKRQLRQGIELTTQRGAACACLVLVIFIVIGIVGTLLGSIIALGGVRGRTGGMVLWVMLRRLRLRMKGVRVTIVSRSLGLHCGLLHPGFWLEGQNRGWASSRQRSMRDVDVDD